MHSYMYIYYTGGLGIGGSVPIVFSLGSELCPSAIRGIYVSVIYMYSIVYCL